MKRTTKTFLYIVFALVALVFFLYSRFPSDMVKYALSERVKQIHPDARIDTNEISPSFPPGLILEPLSANYNGLPILRMDYLKIKPDLLSLFAKSSGYSYRAKIGSGDLKGRAETVVKNNREQSNITMTFTRGP